MMSDESRLPKVGENVQSSSDTFFKKKAETMRLSLGKKLTTMRNKNKLVGFTLLGSVCAIYGYTMFSVRQGRLLEDFDKVVE